AYKNGMNALIELARQLHRKVTDESAAATDDPVSVLRIKVGVYSALGAARAAAGDFAQGSTYALYAQQFAQNVVTRQDTEENRKLFRSVQANAATIRGRQALVGVPQVNYRAE